MVDWVAFQIWGRFREHLIANHVFYVTEAQSRLMAQFDDDLMKADADRYAEEWADNHPQRYNPDWDDWDQYWDETASYYQGLVNLRDTTRLSIIAGMYHEWEKQLRDWLAKQLDRHGCGQNTKKTIWKATIDQLFDYLCTWQWTVREQPYFKNLHVCHLVVNVYKHGDGPSFAALKDFAPRLVGADGDLPDPFDAEPDYTDLEVGDTELGQFSDAIVAFWRDLPENTFFSQLSDEPKWLAKAVQADISEQNKGEH